MTIETKRLREWIVGSCNCLTKTPEVSQHDERCGYRIINETADEIDRLREPHKMFVEIGKWSDATFGGQDASGKIAHLRYEVNELADAPYDITEYADCVMLLVDAARKNGFRYQDLLDAIAAKFEINKRRKWGKPNADGAVFHEPEDEA